MIESSITEEIREENYSEKTSSASPQSTEVNKKLPGTQGDLETSNHVIVQEGVASMFQHPASMVVTEEGTENSPRLNTDANEQ